MRIRTRHQIPETTSVKLNGVVIHEETHLCQIGFTVSVELLSKMMYAHFWRGDVVDSNAYDWKEIILERLKKAMTFNEIKKEIEDSDLAPIAKQWLVTFCKYLDRNFTFQP